MIRSVGCDLPSILGPSALAIKVGSLLVEEVRWDTSSSNLIGPPPWIFLKKRYLRLVLKCPPLIIDKHYSLSCSTCDGGGANISNITKLSTLKKNLLALHLYLYPCISITNTWLYHQQTQLKPVFYQGQPLPVKRFRGLLFRHHGGLFW